MFDGAQDNDVVRDDTFIYQSLESEELVRVDGEIDIGNEHRFEEALMRAGRRNRPVVVDLTTCSYLDSRAIKVLVKCAGRFPLRVLAPDKGMIKHILSIAQLSSVLAIDFSTSP